MFIMPNPKMPDEITIVKRLDGFGWFDIIESADGFLMVEWAERFKNYLNDQSRQSVFRTIDRVRLNVETAINAIHPKNRSIERVQKDVLNSLDLDMRSGWINNQMNWMSIYANN